MDFAVAANGGCAGCDSSIEVAWPTAAMGRSRRSSPPRHGSSPAPNVYGGAQRGISLAKLASSPGNPPGIHFAQRKKQNSLLSNIYVDLKAAWGGFLTKLLKNPPVESTNRNPGTGIHPADVTFTCMRRTARELDFGIVSLKSDQSKRCSCKCKLPGCPGFDQQVSITNCVVKLHRTLSQ